ncbi:MAG TPA: bifunctional oligoribonuclease/PAP phosphatase NrnA [Frankiaceae bacterium]|nr:bifunctional oligoribonuclease/PAP phosphatase NrnA [Frankiaceae bacterium]
MTDAAVRAPAGPVWDEAVGLLRSADEVALACHVGPDGDALGSLLALAIGLRSLGKRVVASWGSEPFEVPAQYAFLPGLDLLTPPESFPAAPELLVTFDTGSLDRLGVLAGNAKNAAHVVVVDHHVSNTRFGTVNLLDTDAAASALLVDELLRRLGVPIDADIAACLYTGLTTDTGSFKYQATTPAVHGVAARLLETGIDHAAIAREVWDTKPFGYVKLLGVLLGRATLEDGLVWTWSTQADFAAYGVTMDDIEGAIDVLRTTVEAEVAVICKETPEGSYAVSMRAKGATDVGAAAVSLGGGGHRYAAGFTSEADLATTMDRLRTALRRPRP